MQKLLSIAVPCYNSEKTLQRCLDSLIDARTLSQIEVLIINDGSTDQTPHLAGHYTTRYPSAFFLINKENGGHGSAINMGIQKANGKYFAILDSDDWYDTEAFCRLLDFLKTRDEDLISANMTSEYQDHTTATAFPETLPLEKPLPFTAICADAGCIDLFILSRIFIKTSILKEQHIRVPEKTYYVDFSYITMATSYVKTVVFTSVNVYHYRLDNVNQSVSCENFVKNKLHHRRVALQLIEFYNAHSKEFCPEIQRYVQNKILRIVKFHYSIVLIYDKNKKDALHDAKAFRSLLYTANKDIAKRCEKRYHTLKALAIFGIDHPTLEKLKTPLKRMLGK